MANQHAPRTQAPNKSRRCGLVLEHADGRRYLSIPAPRMFDIRKRGCLDPIKIRGHTFDFEMLLEDPPQLVFRQRT